MTGNVITLTQLINAQKDALALESIINEAEWVEVQTRLGRKCYSISTIGALIKDLQVQSSASIKELKQAIEIAASTGAGEHEWYDLIIQAWTGNTQNFENKHFITSCKTLEDLQNLAVTQDRLCRVEGLENGIYQYQTQIKSRIDGYYIIASNQGGCWVRQKANISNKTNFNTPHKKEIFGHFPWCFDGYFDAIGEWGYTDETAYLYPGGFCLDEENQHLYIASTPSWDMQTTYISVYDYTKQGSASNITWFRLNNNSINEGLVVTRCYEGLKLFSMQNATGVLFEYDIATMPSKGQFLTEAAQHPTGGFNEFSFDEDNCLWYIESRTPQHQGTTPSRNNILVYDKSFNLVDNLQLPLQASNYVTIKSSSQSNYLPKRQGFDVKGGRFYATYGSIHDGDNTDIIRAQYQGCKVYNLDGSLVAQSLHSPLRFRDNKRVHYDPEIRRSEYEGCRVMRDGTILGLMMDYGRLNSVESRKEKGITIFKEMYDSDHAFDYTSSACNVIMPNLTQGWYLERTEGNRVLNPFSGQSISALSELCEIMRAGQIPQIIFSSSAIELTGFDGNKIPSELVITLTLVTTNNIAVESRGINQNVNFFPSFTASYIDSTWQVRATNTTVGGNLILNTGFDGRLSRNFVMSRNANGDNPILMLDQQSDNVAKSNLLVIGGGSGLYAGATQLRFATSDNPDGVGGVPRWLVDATALFPYADNKYSIGTGNRKPNVIFSATGTINTSDQREKTSMRSVIDAEKLVAKQILSKAGFYKYLDAVADKGDEARWHYGVMAQDVIKAFTDNGLDWSNYAMICYDKWEAVPAEYDENGVCISEETPAGDRYGVRLDQLSFFCTSVLLSSQ